MLLHQAARFTEKSLQTEGRSPRTDWYAPYLCAIVPRLVVQMGTIALGSLTLLGLGFAMGPRDDPSAVQVATDRSIYSPGAPIVVTIVNRLSVPIYALSGQTYCTIVTVQRRVEGQWSSEGRCLSFAPPNWTEIPSSGSMRLDVRPRLPSDRPLAPGQHRAMLTFTVGQTTGPSATAFSSEFLISDQGSRAVSRSHTSCPIGQLA